MEWLSMTNFLAGPAGHWINYQNIKANGALV
jgi:hypothetical protein